MKNKKKKKKKKSHNITTWLKLVRWPMSPNLVWGRKESGREKLITTKAQMTDIYAHLPSPSS